MFFSSVWECHQGRWGRISDSAPLGNFASATERWWEHCKAQKACNCTWRGLGMVNAVYCFKDSSILIYQNLDFRSRHEKWAAPTKLSNSSWILVSGYESFLYGNWDVKSPIQKCRLQSFLLTNTTMLHHMLWLGQIVPEFNIFLQMLINLLYKGYSIHLNHSLNGVSSVTLITCLVKWVQPSLLGSSEKTLWYLAKRDWAEATSSGGQDSKPLKYNSSNNFSCLCFTVNLGTWWLWSSPSTLSSWFAQGLSYLCNHDCPHYWGLLP